MRRLALRALFYCSLGSLVALGGCLGGASGGPTGNPSPGGGAADNSGNGGGGGGATTPGADMARASGGGSGDMAMATTPGADMAGGTANPDTTMSFFVTSRGMGKGGDLRAAATDTDGLAGADAFCKTLAAAVSPALGAKTWHAYLSTTTVNARDRIGTGPWRNAKGLVIANSVAQLHEENGLTNLLNIDNSLDETGAVISRTPLVHDILTGSDTTGRLMPNLTCNNWTSSAATGISCQVGHSDRNGGGSTSWNSVHTTGGCADTGTGSVRTGGGRGSLFCFAL